MQFLAVGHKIRISFLRNAEQIQKISYKIQNNLDWLKKFRRNLEEIQRKLRQNSEEFQRKFWGNSEEIQIFLEEI